MRATTDRGAVLAGVLAVVATAAALAACPGPRREFLDRPDAPPAMKVACETTVEKCSRCHDPERLAAYRAESPRRVRTLVDRMRRLQGSNITPSDGAVITDCLVFRQWGDKGLLELHGGNGDE